MARSAQPGAAAVALPPRELFASGARFRVVVGHEVDAEPLETQLGRLGLALVRDCLVDSGRSEVAVVAKPQVVLDYAHWLLALCRSAAVGDCVGGKELERRLAARRETTLERGDDGGGQ